MRTHHTQSQITLSTEKSEKVQTTWSFADS